MYINKYTGFIVTGITVVEEDEDIVMVGSTFDGAIVEDVMSKKRSREEEEDEHPMKK
jgi:hypothetical protein